jgi:hypothetical protein
VIGSAPGVVVVTWDPTVVTVADLPAVGQRDQVVQVHAHQAIEVSWPVQLSHCRAESFLSAGRSFDP